MVGIKIVPGNTGLFPCYGNLDCIRKFDVVEDKPVNNFIGSKSTEYNLSLIPQEILITNAAYQRPDGVFVVPVTALKQ